MIPIAMLTAGRLGDAKPGDLFMPREVGEMRFLLGTLNGRFTVAVTLDGPKVRFLDISETSQRRGFIINDYELLVDPASSTAFRYQDDEKAPSGSLVLSGRNVGIYAVSKNSTLHVVMLSGEQINDEELEGVAFREWVLSAKFDHERHELFRFSALEQAAS